MSLWGTYRNNKCRSVLGRVWGRKKEKSFVFHFESLWETDGVQRVFRASHPIPRFESIYRNIISSIFMLAFFSSWLLFLLLLKSILLIGFFLALFLFGGRCLWAFCVNREVGKKSLRCWVISKNNWIFHRHFEKREIVEREIFQGRYAMNRVIYLLNFTYWN